MPSSTSSSEQPHTLAQAPQADWRRVLWLGLAVALGVAVLLEAGLRFKGYAPTVQDGPELWSQFRARASRAAPQDLLLVGASRMQLDADPATLRAATGRRVIQLAIDGGSFVPVLADLAADERVRATVLVDFSEHVLESDAHDAHAASWVAAHRARGGPWAAPSRWSEEQLGSAVRRRLASFADGGTPWTALSTRLARSGRTTQYLTTLPDRSREADYRQVPLPAFALGRAVRHVGLPEATLDGTLPEVQARVDAAIDATPAAELTPVAAERIGAVARDVAKLKSRGAQVVFVRFPTSGAVRRFDQRRYPSDGPLTRAFRERVGAPLVEFDRHPALAGFTCPDGSHLDRRDRARFSRALAQVLAAEGWLPAPGGTPRTSEEPDLP